MAHYAKLKKDNVVEQVVVVNSVSVDEDDEHKVNEYLEEIGMPGTWKKCSYNTIRGVHMQNGIPFRGNYPGAGMIYDEDNDIFINPQPYPSWTLNVQTASWEPPTPMPETDGSWIWNENLQIWKQILNTI